jgi:hypothetical protein
LTTPIGARVTVYGAAGGAASPEQNGSTVSLIRHVKEGIIQQRYGIAWDETRKRIASWHRSQGLE